MSTTYTVAAIVEGHGDVQALPVLLRRLEPRLRYPRPIRVPRPRILDDSALPRYLKMAQASIREHGGEGGILIVFDADDDCPAELAPRRATFATNACGMSCKCVVPTREFEAWLIAGDRRCQHDNPEGPRDAKQVLRATMGRYTETADQARLAAAADIEDMRRYCRSFRKLEKVIAEFRAHARLDH